MQTKTTETAQRSTPHRPAPKPERKPSTAALTIPTPAEAEGILLRLAERMDKGAGNHPDARWIAREHLRGIVAGWAILGLFDDTRRDQVNRAIDTILGTQPAPPPVEATALGVPDAPAASASDPSPGSALWTPAQQRQYADAVAIVRRAGMASASGLQREMNIGYNAARRLIESMTADGIIGDADMFGVHRVLSTEDSRHD